MLGDLEIRAKISLSDVDNKRGYEMTVSGSGFNNGTSAGVYVLHYPGAGPTDKTTWPSCAMIIGDGTKVGGALVGSDDKVAVTFEVTAPTFRAGKDNYICMVDGEGLESDTDVEDFNLEPSIKVVPSSVAAGDTVNVFAQDYPSSPGGFVELKVAGHVLWQAGAASNAVRVTARSIGTDGSGEVTFEVPGGLEGTLRIDAKWGDTSKDSKISIAGAELSSSKSAVLPNETITITGNGFGSQTCIPTSNITLDNVSVMVDAESISTSGGCKDSSGVEVSNSGQFVATVVLWPAPREDGTMPTNPTLIPGTHELSVEDSKGFGGSVSVTIAEPTIMVTPDVAGPGTTSPLLARTGPWTILMAPAQRASWCEWTMAACVLTPCSQMRWGGSCKSTGSIVTCPSPVMCR